MPATESTWRNTKSLHVVFGLSSVAMLLCTFWMFYQDHARQWKDYQLKYQDLEAWSTESRIYGRLVGDYQAGFDARQRTLDEILGGIEYREDSSGEAVVRDAHAALKDLFLLELAYRAAGPPDDLQEAYFELSSQADRVLNLQNQVSSLFVRAANYHEQPDAATNIQNVESRLEAAKAQLIPATAELRAAIEEFAKQVPAIDDNQYAGAAFTNLVENPSRQRREVFITALKDYVKQARFVEDNLSSELKNLRAMLEQERSGMDLQKGVLPPAEIARMQAKVDARIAQIDSNQLRFEVDTAHRKRLEQILAAIQSAETAAQKDLDDYSRDLSRLEKQFTDSRDNWGRSFLRAPVFDAFNTDPNFGIQQIWLPELPLDRNFNQVARFDRCGSCHLGIEKTQPGSAFKPGYPSQERVDNVTLSTQGKLDLEAEVAKLRGEVEALEKELQTGQLAEDVAENKRTELEAKQTQLADQQSFLTTWFDNDELSVAAESLDAVNSVLLRIYGLQLAEEGVFHRDDVMIRVVAPRSAAAHARLQVGDMIQFVDGARINRLSQALENLLEKPQWGQPLTLRVLRGVPQPYSTHPRLDLFGGSASPHPFASFGCTICHDGQGSATDFEWASHTPSSIAGMYDWAQRLKWFNNVHWPFGMRPARFEESNCMKCHFDMSELEPSKRFPDPPAPKLMEGYHLVQEYGCFGCHEIKGYDGPNKRVGPDLRLEPNYAEAAQQLYVNPALGGEQLARRSGQVFRTLDGADGGPPADAAFTAFAAQLQDASGAVARNADDTAARHRLIDLVAADAERAKDTLADSVPFLHERLYELVAVLADDSTPGNLRKVGPSLRYVGAKLDGQFIYNQILDPSRFRPTSRMPHFMGNFEHLVAAGEESEPAHTQKLEEAEARAAAHFLLAASQPYPYSELAKNVTEEPSAEEGEFLFRTKGCLACHTHEKIKESKQTFGPDLTNLGGKLTGDRGRQWLVSWLHNPSSYHARTRMPVTFLDPIEHKDKDGKITKVTDPAADIAAFLLDTPQDWHPVAMPEVDQVDSDEGSPLRDLALDSLRNTFSRSKAEQYLRHGIPQYLASELKGDEIELVGETTDANRTDKMLRFVGRQTIRKYGCFGCHDVPGFESAKPIGTGLADWGRKEVEKLAFELVNELIPKMYGERGHANGNGANGGAHGATPNGGDGSASSHVSGNHQNGNSTNGEHANGSHGHGLDFRNMENQDKAYFLFALNSHQREGFLWQKLHHPRSFDYEKTKNKRYNERLRMPRFQFAAEPPVAFPEPPGENSTREERDAYGAARAEARKLSAERNARVDQKNDERIEAVMTFILGLVAEPAPAKYQYRPNRVQQAINDGRRVLHKFNCSACHALEMDTWTFDFSPTDERYTLDNPVLAQTLEKGNQDFPFVRPHASPPEIAASLSSDQRGLRSATVTGEYLRDPAEGTVLEEDFNGDEAPDRGIELWHPAVINGVPYRAGDQVQVSVAAIASHYPGQGGYLWRQIATTLAADPARVGHPTGSYTAFLSWGPPPLFNEGKKVRTEWLNSFLLDPQPIRPMAVLRMPKFNMSPADAQALANYFAARDGMDFPYEFTNRTSPEHLARENAQIPNRLHDAFMLVTNKAVCVQCHSVAEYTPQADIAARAPNLANVTSRFRPEFLRDWIANPKLLLPYTGMPQNINPLEARRAETTFVDPSLVNKDGLFGKGTAVQQVEALTDLLLNFDTFFKRRQEIEPNEGFKKEEEAASGE